MSTARGLKEEYHYFTVGLSGQQMSSVILRYYGMFVWSADEYRYFTVCLSGRQMSIIISRYVCLVGRWVVLFYCMYVWLADE